MLRFQRDSCSRSPSRNSQSYEKSFSRNGEGSQRFAAVAVVVVFRRGRLADSAMQSLNDGLPSDAISKQLMNSNVQREEVTGKRRNTGKRICQFFQLGRPVIDSTPVSSWCMDSLYSKCHSLLCNVQSILYPYLPIYKKSTIKNVS